MKGTRLRRFRQGGSPEEFGDTLVAFMQVTELTDETIEHCVDTLLTATSDMEGFLELADPKKDSVQATHFTIRFGETLERASHEREFWKRAVEVERIQPKIAQYVEQVNCDEPWENFQDEGHSRGAFAMAELIIANPKWCPLFGRLLFTWDMDHEAFQEAAIDHAFRKHGLNEHTTELLAHRVMASGQCVTQQVASALHQYGFVANLDLSSFAKICAELLSKSPCPDILLNQFAEIFANGDEAAYLRVQASLVSAGICLEIEPFDAERSKQLAAWRVAYCDHWDDDGRWTSVEKLEPGNLKKLSGSE